MRKVNKIFLLFSIIACLLLIKTWRGSPMIYAETPEERLERLSNEIRKYEAEIKRLSAQANTLSNQIAQYDAQIALTTLKISSTEEKISLLGGRIEQLEVSLRSLTNAFATRASETYKMARLAQPLILLITARDLSDAVSRFHYLQRIQEADRELLLRLQDAQFIYKEQNAEEEALQEKLKEQKKVLGAQKAAKANLLAITRSDEKRYQELLARARAEFEAIQAIIAGKGEETEVGPVGEGARIASIIPSPSACSTGAHLHFEVVKDGAHQNPTSFLIPKGVEWDNTPDGPFSFSGSWQWPINDPIRITQGYGMTYYASTLRYYGGSPHTGLDMTNNSDRTVKAVKPGALFRGAIACGGGTLRYMRVKQEDNFDTYYLHINY